MFLLRFQLPSTVAFSFVFKTRKRQINGLLIGGDKFRARRLRKQTVSTSDVDFVYRLSSTAPTRSPLDLELCSNCPIIRTRSNNSTGKTGNILIAILQGNSPRTVSGATWAPNTVPWTCNNRTHIVRVPGPSRFELRLPDGAIIPYPLQAIIIAVGLDGVRTKAGPGKRYDIDMYAEGHKVRGAPRLPLNLPDALREYDKEKGLKAALGEELSAAYLKMKHQEWHSFTSHFSQRERNNTLDI